MSALALKHGVVFLGGGESWSEEWSESWNEELRGASAFTHAWGGPVAGRSHIGQNGENKTGRKSDCDRSLAARTPVPRYCH